MEIPKGYKQSKVGIIPEDWQTRNISSCCTIKARIGWQGLTKSEYLDNGDYLLITATDFENGFINWASCFYVSEERYLQDTNIQIQPGDVLISKDGTIGKVAFLPTIPKPGTLNSGVFVVRPKNGFKIDRTFLSLIFKSVWFKEFIDQLTAGSTIVHLYQKDFVKFNLVFPESFDEQKRIADAISDVDELNAALNQQIDKKRQIKEGAMQQLLTGKTRLPGFTEPWKEIIFKDLYKVASEGGTPSTNNNSYYDNGDIPFVKIEDTKNKYIDRVESYITKLGLDNSSAWVIPENNIIFTNGATIGNVAINRIPVSTKQGILGVVIKEDFDLEFIYYILSFSSFQKDVQSKVTIGTFATIILRNLDSIILIVPQNFDEQKAIAQVLSDMDEEIRQLEAERDKYTLVKQGMMQELLTGKIRLN